MSVAPFTERLAVVRHRFVSSLEGRVEYAFAALPKLSGTDADTTVAIDECYQRMHHIVGIGPTVGFISTGSAARAVENLLLPARAAERGLTSNEINLITKALYVLREASQRELQSTFSNWR
jgi:chemotaxis protein histidine kinase CheA